MFLEVCMFLVEDWNKKHVLVSCHGFIKASVNYVPGSCLLKWALKKKAITSKWFTVVCSSGAERMLNTALVLAGFLKNHDRRREEEMSGYHKESCGMNYWGLRRKGGEMGYTVLWEQGVAHPILYTQTDAEHTFRHTQTLGALSEHV